MVGSNRAAWSVAAVPTSAGPTGGAEHPLSAPNQSSLRPQRKMSWQHRRNVPLQASTRAMADKALNGPVAKRQKLDAGSNSRAATVARRSSIFAPFRVSICSRSSCTSASNSRRLLDSSLRPRYPSPRSRSEGRHSKSQLRWADACRHTICGAD